LKILSNKVRFILFCPVLLKKSRNIEAPNLVKRTVVLSAIKVHKYISKYSKLNELAFTNIHLQVKITFQIAFTLG